jgi:hypothetical protein
MERDHSALAMLLVSILMIFLIGASVVMNLLVPFWCFLLMWIAICGILC